MLDSKKKGPQRLPTYCKTFRVILDQVKLHSVCVLPACFIELVRKIQRAEKLINYVNLRGSDQPLRHSEAQRMVLLYFNTEMPEM